MKKKILYSAILLDETSRNLLIETLLRGLDEETWKIFCHHMTVKFGGELPKEMAHMRGQKVDLFITHLARNEKVMAVKVGGKDEIINFSGYEVSFPHITLAANEKAGGKPQDSYDLTDWVKLEEPFLLSGIFENVYSTALDSTTHFLNLALTEADGISYLPADDQKNAMARAAIDKIIEAFELLEKLKKLPDGNKVE